MSNKSVAIEGVLYIEIGKVWQEMHCQILSNGFLQAFQTSKSSKLMSIDNKVALEECECKSLKYGLADLSKIMKRSKWLETPSFFKVVVHMESYMFATTSEEDRSNWMAVIRKFCTSRSRDELINSPSKSRKKLLLEESTKSNLTAASEKSPSRNDSLLGPVSNVKTLLNSKSRKKSSSMDTSDSPKASPINRSSKPLDLSQDDMSVHTIYERPQLVNEFLQVQGKNSSKITKMERSVRIDPKIDYVNEEDDVNNKNKVSCCKVSCPQRLLWINVDTIVRLLKVCTAFPFVIVVSSLNLSNKFTILRSMTIIRLMNILIYVAPIIYIQFVLSQYPYASIQRISIGLYILLYLFPVAYVVLSKLTVSSSTSKIEEGTFCFKPARAVRFTQANFYAIFGFIVEWLQHILYVFPVGIVTGDQQTRLSDFPPYLNFKVYFWITVACTFLCGLILILNAVLKGRLHYRFQKSYSIWFFMFNVSSPMFVTFVTILLMSLWCDYSQTPPTLVQDPTIVCYQQEHIVIARAALIALAVYFIQHTLLPSGTFKETMRDNDLEIMFVPVYLQAHFLFKAIFCGFYVYFYQENLPRAIVLTFINVVLLLLNNFMKPCSVSWVNVMRDAFFIHATLSGIQSLNYLSVAESRSTKSLEISTLASNVAFTTIGFIIYYYCTSRSTEYSIATAFLDLEWQVSRGGSVHPRVLEPLISLTLSVDKNDWEIAKKYTGQLVWLISYPNLRVQFQSAWGLANLALLDDDARKKIHAAGGTKTLFDWYTSMDFVVQLEALAALTNLTLSAIVADEMVSKHKCIPFFIELVASNKLKHAQFAIIALSNLASKETFRAEIRLAGGIPVLVGCILSHDYQKRRNGCRALANMALSPTKEIEQVFESKGLIDRIIKMAVRKEIETQREVVALIRNLACHARLRPLLLDRGVMDAVNASKLSVFEDVVLWTDDITQLLGKEVTGGSLDLQVLLRRAASRDSYVGETDHELLKRMAPLQGKVEWSTWGSKLETIFEPVFSALPTLTSFKVSTMVNLPVKINLIETLAPNVVQRWRDSWQFVVLERPAHGKLNEYNTTSEQIIYTPNIGYTGTDLLTYRIQCGGLHTSPATIAIKIKDHYEEDVEDPATDKKNLSFRFNIRRPTFRMSRNIENGMKENDIEMGGIHRSSASRKNKDGKDSPKSGRNQLSKRRLRKNEDGEEFYESVYPPSPLIRSHESMNKRKSFKGSPLDMSKLSLSFQRETMDMKDQDDQKSIESSHQLSHTLQRIGSQSITNKEVKGSKNKI